MLKLVTTGISVVGWELNKSINLVNKTLKKFIGYFPYIKFPITF
jgi:hypothetical protein